MKLRLKNYTHPKDNYCETTYIRLNGLDSFSTGGLLVVSRAEKEEERGDYSYRDL